MTEKTLNSGDIFFPLKKIFDIPTIFLILFISIFFILLHYFGFNGSIQILYIPLFAVIFFLFLLSVGYLPNIFERYFLTDDLQALVEVISRTGKIFGAQGGEYFHGTWNDQHVVKALDQAIEKKVKIELIGGHDFDINSIELANRINDGKINYYPVNNRINDHHFRFNDRNDILYHNGDRERNNKIIWYNNRFAINDFKDIFESNKANIIPIQPGQFYSELKDHFIDYDTKGNTTDTIDPIKINKMKTVLRQS